jgi:hypothetical protein
LVVWWQKCCEQHWFALETLDTRRAAETGVYIIWRSGQVPRTVRVGIGWLISDCLKRELCDPRVLEYGRQAKLYVTWAFVAPERLERVECFLHRLLRPLVRNQVPDCLPMPVNLPASLR